MSEQTQFLYLTTTGWKSGKAHEIEIWFVQHEGCYYIVSEGRERAHWVQNIQHHPAISVRVDSVTYAGTGRAVSGSDPADAELMRAVSAKMDAKYEWSEGLIVELKPEG